MKEKGRLKKKHSFFHFFSEKKKEKWVYLLPKALQLFFLGL